MFIQIMKAEQSNTAITYNDQFFFFFQILRKIERSYPNMEIVQCPSESTTFKNRPKFMRVLSE